MNDFIITMLKITALNVMIGIAIYAALITFIHKAQNKKVSNITAHTTKEHNLVTVIINGAYIKEHLSSTSDFSSFVFYPAKIQADLYSYAKRKNKSTARKNNPHTRVRLHKSRSNELTPQTQLEKHLIVMDYNLANNVHTESAFSQFQPLAIC
ncbi:hypothetical protein [Aeromonas veronii]|uniref:hypothetical protein n=1 Tax=Aeromonas veronii TaxID=654 RepID=UPI00191E9684|nr:hypothetical protein [Aeromonas veronii]MBL0566532.1 hypothetical protein [Aeromonas veronii]